jgi:hypothetical protein
MQGLPIRVLPEGQLTLAQSAAKALLGVRISAAAVHGCGKRFDHDGNIRCVACRTTFPVPNVSTARSALGLLLQR